MILKLYKSNISSAVILIPITVISLCVPIFWTEFRSEQYYFDWENGLFNGINQIKWLSFGLTVLMLILNSALINKVFSGTNLHSKVTFVPSLFYLVLISFMTRINFSPEIFVHLILLFVISLIMKLDQNESALHIAFKSALLIGVLTCMSLYSISYFIILLIALFVIKTVNWREIATSFLGVIVPLIYLFSAQYIWTNQISLGQIIGKYNHQNQFQLTEYIQIGLFILILLMSVKSLVSFYSHNTTINKKRLYILMLLFIMSVLMTIFAFYFFAFIDYGLLLPLAILLSVSAINNQTDSLLNLLLTITLIVNIVAHYIA